MCSRVQLESFLLLMREESALGSMFTYHKQNYGTRVSTAGCTRRTDDMTVGNKRSILR